MTLQLVHRTNHGGPTINATCSNRMPLPMPVIWTQVQFGERVCCPKFGKRAVQLRGSHLVKHSQAWALFKVNENDSIHLFCNFLLVPVRGMEETHLVSVKQQYKDYDFQLAFAEGDMQRMELWLSDFHQSRKSYKSSVHIHVAVAVDYIEAQHASEMLEDLGDTFNALTLSPKNAASDDGSITTIPQLARADTARSSSKPKTTTSLAANIQQASRPVVTVDGKTSRATLSRKKRDMFTRTAKKKPAPESPREQPSTPKTSSNVREPMDNPSPAQKLFLGTKSTMSCRKIDMFTRTAQKKSATEIKREQPSTPPKASSYAGATTDNPLSARKLFLGTKSTKKVTVP